MRIAATLRSIFTGRVSGSKQRTSSRRL